MIAAPSIWLMRESTMMFIAGTLPFNGCGQVRELREEHFVFWTLSLAKDVCCMHGRKKQHYYYNRLSACLWQLYVHVFHAKTRLWLPQYTERSTPYNYCFHCFNLTFKHACMNESVIVHVIHMFSPHACTAGFSPYTISDLEKGPHVLRIRVRRGECPLGRATRRLNFDTPKWRIAHAVTHRIISIARLY